MMAKKEQQLDLLDEDQGNYGHGGLREGAGRKKGKGSKLIRVPALLVDQVDTLIKKYRENEMDFDMNEYIKKRIDQLEQDKKGQTLEVKTVLNNTLVELKTLQEKIKQ
ncbi:hypothetical protein [uncultured Aliivibrio sp.]|uniref:hypothetical protein n=1 Tax=uncultured Aliivibrio sp. TaxID=873085 RepID=UPI00261B51A8|nr:hypothetical protein [uncultured Aliivibrio sp.]